MEKKHDNYHIRPFPQQPKRGGKALVATLDQLQESLNLKKPNLQELGRIQEEIHQALANTNDDLLIDMVRQLSHFLDEYRQKPTSALAQKVVKQLLKIRLEIKHL